MSQNRLPLLLTLLVVLLGVAWLTGVFEGNPSTVEVPEVSIPVDGVDRIVATGPLSMTLVRTDSTWRLTEPLEARADSATVTVLLQNLDDLELVSLVSTNPDRYAQYGVDSTAVDLTLSANGESTEIVVATKGPDFQSNYVRLMGDPAVYATRSRISLPTDLDRWRDKHMLGASTVRAAEVSIPGESYSVRPAPGGWTLTVGEESPVPADSAAVARWLQRFSDMKADGYVQGFPADSVRALAADAVTLTFEDGSTARIYMEEHDNALATVVGNGTDVFRLFSSRLRSLAPQSSTLTD